MVSHLVYGTVAVLHASAVLHLQAERFPLLPGGPMLLREFAAFAQHMGLPELEETVYQHVLFGDG